MVVNSTSGAVAPDSRVEAKAAPTGLAQLSKYAFDGGDLQPVWRRLVDRFVYDAADAEALMDLAIVEQLYGDRDTGLARQAEALALRRLYRSPAAATPRLRVLAFAAPGDIGANAPLEFLTEDSDVALDTLYLLPGEALPKNLPPHDVAIVAVAESDPHRPVLAALAGAEMALLNRPERIQRLAREELCHLLRGVPGLAMPATSRITRAALARIGSTPALLDTHLHDGAFPLILRPVDSHAGHGLERIDWAEAIAPYLASRPESEFYLSRFVDYRSADGLYRKYRIVFVDGRAYACHMAIAEQWKIWYLNAGMKANASKRAEEARFMTGFDQEFALRHEAALAGLAERIGLDYFGIDCAETRDGALLLFEADIAMIVHDMDDPNIYPYKSPQMQRIFAAFRALLEKSRR